MSPHPLTQAGDGFVFNTDIMSGRIAPHGAYHGVWQLLDKVSGKELIHPKYSALNLFRLFAVHQGMGQPRFMDRTIECDGETLTIRWDTTEAHQGVLEASYTFSGPASIDLEVRSTLTGNYAGYEIFLSSYFDPCLRPFVYLKPERGNTDNLDHDCVCPMVSDVFRGTVLVFPRDTHMARRCVDGRWDRSEWGAPTVQMCPVRHYSAPVAYLEDADHSRAVVFMSTPDNCASISTRYYADNDADRLTPYSAFDFSLFGRDVIPGDNVRARIRMQLVSLTEDGDAPIEAYEEFLAEAES